MNKRKQPLASLWAGCLCICLCFLVGCNTAPPSQRVPPNLALTQTTNAQVTPDVIFHLVGSYTGAYQWHGSPSSTPIRLQITEQDASVLSGEYILGTQHAPLLKAYVETAFGGQEGRIRFTVDLPASQGQQPLSLEFQGTVTKDGLMAGEVSESSGRTGTWSAKKE